MWSKRSKARRIDGIRIVRNQEKEIPKDIIPYARAGYGLFDRFVTGADVEIIEI